MRILDEMEAAQIDGGFLQILAVVVAVITLPKIINDHRKEYNEWGHDLSQQYWDSTYPYNPNSNSCYGPGC